VKPFNISQPAISKHLKVLERAGLITKDIDKQRRPRRIEAAPMAEANAWLEKYREFWETNYKRLDDLLSMMQADDETTRRKRNGKKRPNG
jgi:DNA-binding transcriptional ArsR family regulator